MQLRCFRLANIDETVEEDEALPPTPDLLSPPPVPDGSSKSSAVVRDPRKDEMKPPKSESLFTKVSPKEEIKPPKKDKAEESQDDFKKVRRYKPMPEGF